VLRILRRFLTGKADKKPRQEDTAEWRWLVSYGISSAIYRTGLMLTIAWMISDRWFLLGIALALFVLFQAVMLPVWRAARVLLRDEELRGVRAKSLAIGVPSVIIAVLMFLPLPHASVTSGVVWIPDEAIIRAASDCEVNEVMIAPGSDVQAGDALFHCVDIQHKAQEQFLVANLAELEASLSGVARSDQVEYAKLQPRVHTARTQLEDVRRRLSAEQHQATVAGRFDISGTSALLGRAFSRGEIAAYTVANTGRTIRLAFAERKIANIDEHVERIEVRINSVDSGVGVYDSFIRHRSPRASLLVPSAALSTVGGGPHAADPAGDGRQLLQSIVDFELNWPSAVAPAPIGEHVGVRFVHSSKPLMSRLINTVRRAFMDRQSV
jgi:putative peptide zinc metalloprotease protein